jgi:hypothetical protein
MGLADPLTGEVHQVLEVLLGSGGSVSKRAISLVEAILLSLARPLNTDRRTGSRQRRSTQKSPNYCICSPKSGKGANAMPNRPSYPGNPRSISDHPRQADIFGRDRGGAGITEAASASYLLSETREEKIKPSPQIWRGICGRK